MWLAMKSLELVKLYAAFSISSIYDLHSFWKTCLTGSTKIHFGGVTRGGQHNTIPTAVKTAEKKPHKELVLPLTEQEEHLLETPRKSGYPVEE